MDLSNSCFLETSSESESESEREKLTLVLILWVWFGGWEEEEKGDESNVNLWVVVGRQSEEEMWIFGLMSEGKNVGSEKKFVFRMKERKEEGCLDDKRKQDIIALAMAVDDIICRTNQRRGQFKSWTKERVYGSV